MEPDRSTAIELAAAIDHDLASLSLLLREIRDRAQYRAWGFTGFKSYVERELGMSRKLVSRLLQVADRAFEAAASQLVSERLFRLGWNKICQVSRMRREQLAQAIELAEKCTPFELERELRRIRHGSRFTEEHATPLTFPLFPRQRENVEDAIELAGKIAGSDKRGHLLDLICTSFKMDNIFQTQPGDKLLKHFLGKTAAIVDVNLIATERGSGEIIMGKEHLVKAVSSAPAPLKQQIRKEVFTPQTATPRASGVEEDGSHREGSDG